MEKKYPAFARRLRDLRSQRPGLTQAALAAELGTSRAHVAKMETGGDMPGRQILGALAKVYGVSMEYLESGADPALPDQPRSLSDDPGKIEMFAIWDDLSPDEREFVLSQFRGLRKVRPRRRRAS
jgi:transcriptional regulator with XRE-family HTH domain